MKKFKPTDMSKEYSITKTFRIKQSLLEEMEKLAEENNMSLNRFGIECIEFAIKNLDMSSITKNNEEAK